ALPEGWTTPVNISPNLTFWSHEPRLITNAVGTKVYVVWTEEGGGGKRVFFNTNAAGSWGNVTNISTPLYIGEQSGPEIDMDTNGDFVVSFQARISSGNYEMVSRKYSGGSFAPYENVSRTSNGGSIGGGIMIDPTTNDYYVAYQDDWERPTEDATYWGIYLDRKPGGTGFWTGAGRIPDETNRSYFPENRMNAKGHAFVIWDNRAAAGISHVWFSENKKPADKLAWSACYDVSGDTGTADNYGFAYPRLAVDDDDNVYICWLQNIGNWEAFLRKRIRNKWLGRENVSKTPGKSAHSTVAANHKTGEIYLAWAENTTTGWSIFMKTYTNQNAQKMWKWSEAYNMTPDAQTSDYPTLYADASGGIHLVYTSNKANYYQIWYTGKLGEVTGFPPSNLAAASQATAADPRQKDTTLTWEANPANESITIESYKIYRKKQNEPDAKYALLKTVDDKVYQYKDAGLLGVQVYTYKVTSVAKGNLESEGATADDQLIPPPVFPPLDLAVSTVLSEDIYQKTNTLRWAKNPQNRAGELSKYRIFRKKADQDDAAYALVVEVDPSVLKLDDAGLTNDELYTYAATTSSTYSQESARSSSVTDVKVFAPTYPPSGGTLSTRIDPSAGVKMNVLSWEENPLNAGLPIQTYRIYRKADNAASYNRIGSVGADVRRFDDDNLATGRKYTYRLSSVPEWGIESGQGGAFGEVAVFPPINVSLQTSLNRYFLTQEKVNRLVWVRNALNDPVTVTSYKVYRRRSTETDAAFAVVATVDGATFAYVDRGLAPAEAFVYRLTTVDSEGRESEASVSHGEI
ncbi:MAG: fibronectin type III domain-containing protein, partial [Candidatus Aminicenantes bacterium]|nr:fibronectin type III domain-containing protein [Candidatus Aminicenantes bacterium]